MTRSKRILTTFLLAAMACLAIFAAPAAAKAPCWKLLINDWYDGRIDGSYAVSCYRDALKHLPADVETYSSARDDIKQAMQRKVAGVAGPYQGRGHPPITPTSNNGDKPKGDGSGNSTTTTKTGGPGKHPGDGGPRGPGPTEPGSGNQGPVTKAIDAGANSADSVPIPLLVLGGLALLLMAAGAAGFATRRVRTRRMQLAALSQTSRTPPTPPE